jgi:hypothetical protein
MQILGCGGYGCLFQALPHALDAPKRLKRVSLRFFEPWRWAFNGLTAVLRGGFGDNM